jgi:hypothetical protein
MATSSTCSDTADPAAVPVADPYCGRCPTQNSLPSGSVITVQTAPHSS